MIHLDIKKLGRFETPGHRATGTRAGCRQGSGWEHGHICVDDASRIACGGLFPDGRRQSAIESLRVSVGYYKRIGVTVRRVMTDNGVLHVQGVRRRVQGDGHPDVRAKPCTPLPRLDPPVQLAPTALRHRLHAAANALDV